MFNERLSPKTEVKTMTNLIPRLVVSQTALNKMWNYVEQCADEVGWLGTIEKLEGAYYHLKDVYLFHQEVHATTTEINPEGLTTFATELLTQPDGMDIWNSIKLWGHSHVNMGLTPSGQDDAQMRTFAEVGHDIFFRLIANKKKELKVDLFNYANTTTYLDIPWEVLQSVEEEALQVEMDALQARMDSIRLARVGALHEDIKAEMTEKVKKKVYGTQIDYTKKVWVPHHWQWDEAQQKDVWIAGMYRDKTAAEIARDEEEKKTRLSNQNNSNGNTSETTNGTMGGMGTNIVPFKEEIKELNEKQMSDLLAQFEEEDIITIGYCQSMGEVAREIYKLGFSNVHFTWSEKKALYEYAYQKLVADFEARGYQASDI